MNLSAAVFAAPSAACGYCGGPLPPPRPDPQRPGQHTAQRFCCYGCRVLGEGGRKQDSSSRNPNTSVWVKVAIGAAIFGQMMVLDLAVNLSGAEEPGRLFLHGALWVGTVVVLLLLGPLLLREVRAQFPRPSVDAMFLAGILGAFGASVHSTLTGVGAVYYQVVAVLLTVYTAGKTLGAQSRARAFSEAQRFQETFASCQCVLPDGSLEQRPASSIRPGERVQVLAGEPIPVDGRIVAGQAFVQQGALTGEPYPVVRRPGDDVLAGSYSEDGDLIVTATRPGTERALDGLLALSTAARVRTSRVQAQADRITAWFLPLVLAIACGTLIYWTWRTDWTVGLFNALAVLVVACPCALGLATPIALWNGMAVLAARGFVIRDPDAIEQMARLTHVACDKTGTLSEESCSVIDLSTAGSPDDRAWILRFIHAVEARSNHPVARAFQSYFGATAPDGSVEVRRIKLRAAQGIEAWVLTSSGSEHHVKLGQPSLIKDMDAAPALQAHLASAPGDQLIYVEVDNRLAAIAAIRERLRPSAADLFASLRELGVESSILTGDCSQRATQLGLPNPQGSLTPEAKARIIEELQAAGQQVGFAGDGANDAPAMNAARVGIALGHGAGLTQANADAVLYGGDMGAIPWAIQVCRDVTTAIRSNLAFALFYNCVGIALAATGYLHPVVAVLLMVGSSLIVSWRATRAAQAHDFCCGPAIAANRSAFPRARPRTLFSASAIRAFAESPSIAGMLIVLQAPFIIYLGQLNSWPAAWTAVALLGLGVLAIVIGRRIARQPASLLKDHWQMSFAMLGVGNAGMLLGWWVEAGFAPVAGQGLCLGCCGRPLSSLGEMHVPWMYVGMLLFGLPPMFPRRSPGESRWSAWLACGFSAAGMVVGMAYGAQLGLHWAGATPTSKFLWVLAAMVVGMTLGMAFGCELGKLIRREIEHRRRSRHTVWNLCL